MEAQAIGQDQFAELSMRQVYYLETILRMESPTFSDVAQNLDITKPSVTAIVEKLIRKGYVEKVQSDKDRRTYHIVPTAKAVEFSRLHENTHRQLAQLFMQNLNETEIQQLAGLLQKVLQNKNE
ncbi:MAG: MarR family transcriptional regulator [Anaerolineales bacterium]|nr:MarR family transcriptional regulator [Anaerolineales bacterium]